MRIWVSTFVAIIGLVTSCASSVSGQYLQFPQTSTQFRDIQSNSGFQGSGIQGSGALGPTIMVPLNPATQRGLYPSIGAGGPLFDPYSTRPSFQNPGFQLPPSTTVPPNSPFSQPQFSQPQFSQPQFSQPPYSQPTLGPALGVPPSTSGQGGMFGNPMAQAPYGSPQYSGIPTTVLPGLGGGVPAGYGNSLTPGYPGLGTSGSIGSFNGGPPANFPTNIYPNSAPPSLFPTSMFGNGSFLGNLFGTNPTGYGTGLNPPQAGYGVGGYSAPGYSAPGYGAPGYGAPGYGYTAPGYTMPGFGQGGFGNILAPGAFGNWNPQGSVAGSMAGTWPGTPQFVRFFQGPRFRHAFLYGNNTPDSLQINDSDLSLAFAVPNFLFSNQPLYVLPSFSLHQWDGPSSPSTADLPSKAYSAFLDAGWQSDPLRILGAELGARVGVFSDFETYTSDSLRVMGRGLGRMRLTPTATLKAGAVYLDRNRVKLLPAGGILWQPNPVTRFDLFFPEPKLAHYLSTVGTYDTWWYVGGYYGGGAWTVKRANGTKDSIDINDLRLLIGLEWGRNEQMRDGRRLGFTEIGYVFNRELLYKHSTSDNIDLDDSFVIRAGIGY